ncbi:hypothetical protein A5320_08215 [Rheinheimera sp. SA_1]|uniref:hypothetical protein n=1 Tax=Rheinheimera sp. SA_1 TaxID=1827365 RepID=UPI0007FC4798|nr:hypothetical protein [Rheinheimera sp. SA_1]OBP15338.1 hypothetical protein A5320_08215 [Rheinheimera sp. SA_1]
MYSVSQEFEKKFLSFVAAFIFATAFLLIDWEALQGIRFEDRGIYFYMFQGKPDVEVDFSKETFFFFLFNEQLWNKGVRWLNTSVGLSLNEIFGAVTFLTAFSYSYFIASRVGLLGIIFLINPIFVDLACSQLRMAAAMVLLLFAYNVKVRFLIFLLVCAAFFIHTATFLFAFIAFAVYLVIKWSEKYEFQNIVSCMLLVFTGFLVALTVGPLRGWILGYLGDRRVNYDVDASNWSYASIWVFILAMCYFQERRFFRDYSNAIAVTFLSVFVFCTVFSVYGLRFLSAALPFIFVSLFRFGSVEKPLVILTFMAFSIVQWIYWVR